MKPQVYKDERPAEHFTGFHERVRRGPPDWMYEVVRLVLTPFLLIVFRVRAIDVGNVPATGPVLIAPNHFSFVDHFFVAVFLRRKVQFMAKSQLFKPPLQTVYTHGGVFPVLRGRRDEEAFKTAHAVLARGGAVVMYAEAGRSRSGQLGEARPGIGRLALESGVPVVPVAIAGSQKVRNWKKGQLPQVTVQYAPPIQFEQVAEPTRDQSQAAAEQIFDEVKKIYGPLMEEGRKRAVARARAARRGRGGTAEPAAG